MLNRRIVEYLENNNLLLDEQNGFRANRSCLDHVFVLTNLIRTRLEHNKDTFVAFIDVQKAFDHINRDLLFSKLLKFGIKGKMYFAVKSLLSFTDSCVRINNMYTEFFNINCGVRQGDVISPTLFSIFINDLVAGINEMNLGINIMNSVLACLLYADDLVIFAENESNLNIMLQFLNIWCSTWLVTINMKKSNVIHFRSKRKLRSEYVFRIGSHKLLYVNSYKYLGVYLDQHLTFVENITNLAGSGSRALGKIISLYKNNRSMGLNTYRKLYESCVCPVLDYSCAVWQHADCNKIDQVHNRAMRVFLGLHRFSPILGLEGELGWEPCFIRRYTELARYWNKLILMEPTRLTKQMFIYDYQGKFKRSYCNEVMTMLDSVNLKHIYDNQLAIPLGLLKQKMLSKNNQVWAESIQRKPKLRFYRKFKNEISTESYTLMNIDCVRRSYLAQLRLGILPLSIETGRFRGIPKNERCCLICNNNSIEDEIHFLFQCQGYNDIRTDWFKSINMNVTQLTNDINFKDALKQIFKYPRQTSKYIVNAMDIRRSFLYIR